MTLVELLVSLTVISILASLSLAGLMRARHAGKVAKTETTIRKLSEIILPFYEQYETRRPALTNESQLAALPGGRTLLATAKQAALRRIMALELPERASDITGAFNAATGVSATYVQTYSGVTTVFTDTPPTTRRYGRLTAAASPSSSELLHLIVTRGPVADPDIVAHFRDDETRDTNGNGLREFVDGWNRPIAFRRWPIGFESPMQPIDGTQRNIDPLVSSNGHRLVPLIFSAGPDGAYDIVAEPTGTPLSYAAIQYDPFAVNPSSPTGGPLGMAVQSPAIAGSGVLSAASLTSGGVAGPVVFTFTRLRSGGSPTGGMFQTVGSERDVGSPDDETTPNGVVESRDNIHNHDMTR